jgi:hypothetical protein
MYFPQANIPTPQIRLKSYDVEDEVILNIQFLYVDGGGTVEILDNDDLSEHVLILMNEMLMDDIYQIAMELYPYHLIYPDTEFLNLAGSPVTVEEKYYLQQIVPKGFFAKQGVGTFPRSFIYAEADMIFLYDYDQLEIPEGYAPQSIPGGVDAGRLIAYQPTLSDFQGNPATIWNSNQLKIFSAEYDSGEGDWNILVNPFLGMDLYRPISFSAPIDDYLNPCLGVPPYYLTDNWFISGFSGNCLTGLNTKDEYGLYNLFESEGYENGDGVAARACLYGGQTHRDSAYRGLYFCQRLYDTCSQITIEQQGIFDFTYVSGSVEKMAWNGYVSGTKPTIMKWIPPGIQGGTTAHLTALALLSHFGIWDFGVGLG